jgi:hypothetical protein
MDDYQQKLLEEDPDLHWAINDMILGVLAPLDFMLGGLAKIVTFLGGTDPHGIIPTDEP